MLVTISSILKESNCELEKSDQDLISFFKENGYCQLPSSELILDNLQKFQTIIDDLIETESWRGGWEGKEEHMKYMKKFNNGANRLGNLFNKHELFLKLLGDFSTLKILHGIFNDDMKIGALDMREPLKGEGSQELHIDWLPKKDSDDLTQNVICFIFLDDTDKNNGSMRIVPKTHKKIGWIDDYQKDKSFHSKEINVDVKAGSIVLMDGNLWHSGTNNINGKRRRVLYMDIRRRSIPQLLNQRIYLNEKIQNLLSNNEKFLLGLSSQDEIFEDRVFGVGDYYRKNFNGAAVSESHT